MVTPYGHYKLGITSLVLGVASLLLCWLVVVNFILSVLAIIFGALAFKSSAKGQAIAGFVMGIVSFVLAPIIVFTTVFTALPSMQMNQRDVAAKTNVTTVSSAVISYKSNNTGNLPKSSIDIQGYIADGLNMSILVYKYGEDYTLPEPGSGDVTVITGATCHEAKVSDGVNAPVVDKANARSYATITVLETDRQVYCVD